MELQLLDKLAARACLSFEGEERERMAADLERIVRLMDTVAETELPTELPDSPACGELREDTVQPCENPEELLANAKNRQGAFFAVPKMID